MSLFGKPEGRKYHTRTVEVSTYEYDDGRLAVEGCLTDHRFQKYHLEIGEWRQPGIMHQMKVHWLVNKKSLVIEDLRAEMPVIPDERCAEAMQFVDSIKGLRVTGGFTSKVKELIGGSRGGAHILELMIEMSFSAVQGVLAYKQQGARSSLEDIIRIAENSCWPWRSDGPFVKWLRGKIAAEREGQR